MKGSGGCYLLSREHKKNKCVETMTSLQYSGLGSDTDSYKGEVLNVILERMTLLMMRVKMKLMGMETVIFMIES